MSSCRDLARSARRCLAPAILAVAATLSACTTGPLYGANAAGTLGAAPASALRGQVSIPPALTRTDQLVRNALLFQLNGGETAPTPIYELSFTAIPSAQTVSIERGSGVPTSAIYQLTVSYRITRNADGEVVANGRRMASAAFDRTEQLFAETRALRDARQRAAEEVAAKIALAAAAQIR